MIATGAAACLASCHGDETQQREDIQAEGSGNQNKFSRRSAGETKATRRGVHLHDTSALRAEPLSIAGEKNDEASRKVRAHLSRLLLPGS